MPVPYFSELYTVAATGLWGGGLLGRMGGAIVGVSLAYLWHCRLASARIKREKLKPDRRINLHLPGPGAGPARRFLWMTYAF